jgi:hypothetical protein
MSKSLDRYSLKVVRELKYQRFHHVDPRIRQLIIVVYYHAKGMSTSQIAAIEPLPESLIHAIIQSYEQGGIRALEDSTFLSEKDRRETQ